MPLITLYQGKSELTFPTLEQQSILASEARVTIVKACPGSGKTRVFVEVFKNKLEQWTPGTFGGIAALSFTNVAQNEIKNRIGIKVGKPHFIGTLDSFVLTYIVKPFAHIVGVSSNGIELIPEIIADRYDYPEVVVDTSAMRGRNVPIKRCVHSIRFVGGSLENPELEYYSDIMFKNIPVARNKIESVLLAKKNNWASKGTITHSDTQFLAAKILNDPVHGEFITKLIIKKFPYILVDEFQDTGFFLSKAVKQLLAHCLSGLVIGDPDQSIYEFGGANPLIFNDIEQLDGAESKPITQSHRFGSKIADMICEFSEKEEILSAKSSAGNLYLITHNQDKPEITGELRNKIRNILGENQKYIILTRKRASKNYFVGLNQIKAPSRFSNYGKKLLMAEESLVIGDFKRARKIIESALSSLVFDKNFPAKEDFNSELGVEKWRKSIYIIISSLVGPVSEKWNEWQDRIKAVFKDQLIILGYVDNINTKFMRYTVNNNVVKPNFSNSHAINLNDIIDITTIHQYKGAESDNVVLYVPKKSRNRPSITAEWWQEQSEEMRVAFVALSRAKEKLILCVHEDTLTSLQENRPSFVDQFELIDDR